MFKNRKEAGELLWKKIKEELKGLADEALVLMVVGGGVLVVEGMGRVGKDRDVMVISKIKYDDELSVGAIGQNKGSLYLDERIVMELNLDFGKLQNKIGEIQKRLVKREVALRGEEEKNYKDRVVVIVDDGVVTGHRMIAACREVFAQRPKKVVVAVPVIGLDVLARVEEEADMVIVLNEPKHNLNLSEFYESDEECDDWEISKKLEKLI